MKSTALLLGLTLCLSFVSLAQTPGPVTVISYAGYTGTFPVAPGSIASAYGTFTGVPTTSASTVSPMPKALAGVSLRVNGVDAPLYFVSAGQINFVVPAATPLDKQTVEVVQGGNVIARGAVKVFDIAPGLAQSDVQNTGQGIIQNQDFSINSTAARAKRGEIIQIYATGCGATNPAVTDGVPPTALSPAAAAVKAFIDVQEVGVQFAGAHPQFPGICQVNATVPNLAFISGRVTLFITVNGVASNPVSFWVE
ncbi:MAG: hypothetical protein ABI972_21605 [Acidobacteriota bacterium]